ncbi:PQQ-binding-like beta-propeller repeat protein [Azohydromonas lata]|uniref:PQQ-binding-like beta-propeller repeat protein n=1 Tax=Azohydromonas lata TaxID=45677 RepID=UPI00389941A0
MNGIQDRWPVSRTALQRLGCTVLLAALPLAYAATLAVQPQAGEPASQVDLRGAGMAPFEDVELRYDGTALGTARADASGVFKANDVVIPASALPGSRPIVAVGRGSGTRASGPFLVRTNWPQFHRGTFRHGETPHEQRLGPDNVARLRLLWGVPTGDPADPPLRGAPVLADGLVYVLTSSLKQGRLLALNAATGAQSWSRFTGFSAYCDASPAVAQGRVYAPASRRSRPSTPAPAPCAGAAATPSAQPASRLPCCKASCSPPSAAGPAWKRATRPAAGCCGRAGSA